MPTTARWCHCDGDGITDIVAADFQGSGPIVMKGKGDGTFAPATTYTTVEGAQQEVLVADVNGDGKPDVLSLLPTGVQTWLGGGDGTLKAGAVTTFGGTPGAFTVGKFRSGSTIDMAVNNDVSQQVEVFFGNGDGSFTKTGEYDVTTQPQTPVLADYNRDGKLDIAVAGNANAVSFLKNIS